MLDIIVDNDVAALVFTRKDDPVFSAVNKCIKESKKRVRVVHGGQLTKELIGNPKVRDLLLTLGQMGKAHIVPKGELVKEEKVVKKFTLKSNDVCILALARARNVRVLCTADVELMKDFKNLKIIPKPLGFVYSRTGHSNEFYKRVNQAK